MGAKEFVVGTLLFRAVVGVVLGCAAVGCSNDDRPRYVERVLVASPNAPETRVEDERPKPMPGPWGRVEREAAPAPRPSPEREK
jgi:hypothetical protein